jgi:hypothetical protein
VFALTLPSLWVTDSEAGEAGVRWDPGFDATLPMAATPPGFLPTRLHNQQLVDSKLRKPAKVVSWLGAVQAQDFSGAKWAIGLRSPGCHDADLDQAFNDGLILRTHVLRPTWHFVAPEDIRWLLALSSPRVHSANAYYYRQAGLDAKVLLRTCAMMHRMLEGGKSLTRAELAVGLKRAKVPADGLKLAYLLMHAELEGVICSGPRRGNQFTYTLLEDRVPAGKTLDGDAALCELVKRYFTSHGPATMRDFTWWSGMTVKDTQRGIKMAGKALVEETIDGRPHWSSSRSGAAAGKTAATFLLPNYDEYLIAYKDRGAVVDAARAANIAARTGGAFANHLIVDGRLAGGWSRTMNGNSVRIEVAPYKKLTPVQSRAVANAADCYGEFLGLPATLSLV